MNSFETSFDEAVIRAQEKWPNVPACFGWLKLDRRGNWLIKNAPITHPGALKFINRNYANDAEGRWFIQNGPQRVYCELDYTPLIYRLEPAKTLTTHTGRRCEQITHILLDDEGNVLFETNLGLGQLDDRDLVNFCAAVDAENQADWTEQALDIDNNEHSLLNVHGNTYPFSVIAVADVPERFGFVQTPTASD